MKKSIDKPHKELNDEKPRYEMDEIERSIQETITALEKFVYDRNVTGK